MSWVVEWEGDLGSCHNKRPFQSVTTASLSPIWMKFWQPGHDSSLPLLFFFSHLPVHSFETGERDEDEDGDRSWPA